MNSTCKAVVLLVAAALTAADGWAGDAMSNPAKSAPSPTPQKATLAAGCFWCVEAVFQTLDGVISVRSGYTGGRVANPTYEQVCGGRTGHAEAIEVLFDPSRVSYADILDLFWRAHDPTQLNRQGADVGTQYRSAIFYHDDEQRAVAEASKKRAAEDFEDPIVTEISPASGFYEAERYHQNYFANNPNAPYCMLVIRPKIKKLGVK